MSPILGLWRVDMPMRRSILIGEGNVRLEESLEEDASSTRGRDIILGFGLHIVCFH
jgi:hypothetical protein